MSAPRKRTAPPRAAGGDFFDFTTHPQPIEDHAADSVKHLLRELFARLDRIDERLDAENADHRQAALDALDAVSAFLDASPFSSRDRFSRPLKLLRAELQNAPPSAAPGEILPRRDPEMGASTRKGINHRLMACAAFAADAMHRAGKPLRQAYGEIAATLNEHAFPFGEERDTADKRAAAVEAWRKGNAAAAVRDRYNKLRAAASPIPPGDRWEQDKCAPIRRWLVNELVRAGY